jgi:hypothetical protein
MSAMEFQCCLKAIKSSKLDISKSLWLLLNLVFYNSYICNLASGEKILNVSRGCVEWQVSEMYSKWWLARERKFLTNSIATVYVTAS